MSKAAVVSASEFKAKCLDLFNRLADRSLERVIVTKRGRVVAIVTPPDREDDALEALHGFMRGSVVIAPDVDLTAAVCEDTFTADEGVMTG